MSESNSTRRRFLQLTGSAAIAGLAGCSSIPGGDDTTTESGSPTQNETETTTETEPKLTPTDHKSVHKHGFLTFSVNGQRADYDESRFYETETGNKHFHFHERTDENLWHVHSKNLSVEWGLNSLPGINVTGTPKVTINGTTYDASESGTSIEITVNNEMVDPKTYVLKERDHVEVLIDAPASKAPTTGGSNNTTSGMNNTSSGTNTTSSGTNNTSNDSPRPFNSEF